MSINTEEDTLFRKVLKVESYIPLKVESYIPSKGRGRFSQINREMPIDIEDMHNAEKMQNAENMQNAEQISLNTPITLDQVLDFDSDHFKNRQVLDILINQEPVKKLSMSPPKGIGKQPNSCKADISTFNVERSQQEELSSHILDPSTNFIGEKEQDASEPVSPKSHESIKEEAEIPASDIIILDISKPYKPPTDIYKVLPPTIKNKKTKSYLAQITVKYGIICIQTFDEGNIKFKQSMLTGYFIGPYKTSITFLFTNNNITIPIRNIQSWSNVIRTLDDLISNKRCFFPLF